MIDRRLGFPGGGFCENLRSLKIFQAPAAVLLYILT